MIIAIKWPIVVRNLAGMIAVPEAIMKYYLKINKNK